MDTFFPDTSRNAWIAEQRSAFRVFSQHAQSEVKGRTFVAVETPHPIRKVTWGLRGLAGAQTVCLKWH